MFQDALVFGLIYSAWVSLLVLVSFRHEPRIWLHHFPEQMQSLVPPKSAAEERLMKLWAIPTTGSMLLLPLVVALLLHPIHEFSYFSAFGFIGLMMLVFCVVDLIVLDWLICVRWSPAFMRIAGTEEMAHHNNFRFHLVRGVQGLVFPLFGAAIAALLFIWF